MEKIATLAGLVVVFFGAWIILLNPTQREEQNICASDNAVAVRTYPGLVGKGYVCIKNTAITEVN